MQFEDDDDDDDGDDVNDDDDQDDDVKEDGKSILLKQPIYFDSGQIGELSAGMWLHSLPLYNDDF